MQAVIIAGGKGTRLKEYLGDLPKPMVEVGGRPLLEHQILLAKRHGIDDLLILTGHGAEHIESFFGDGSRFGVRIRYRREAEPLGTAGCVVDALPDLHEQFLVLYGDTMLDVDLARMFRKHPANADATLFLHPNSHPFDSDLVEIDEERWVTAIHPYPHPENQYFRNLVNAALYVCTKRALIDLPRGRAMDFGKQVFPQLLQRGRKLYGYVSTEYIRDAGTPQRLLQVRDHYARGLTQRTKRPAIFFDRDGTLNFERNWLSKAEDLELMPTVPEAVRAVNESGHLAVVITNQPVIARGECSAAGLRRIHDKLEWLLGIEHAYLDAIYFCPHHPDRGFPGERPELKGPCACRKPGTALFELAATELDIDVERSWMIGDRQSDIDAAKALGLRSVLIRSHHLPHSSGADREADTLLDAVRFALGRTDPA